jgi:RNA polymerase sigma-70 factor (ECF subfamily)
VAEHTIGSQQVRLAKRGDQTAWATLFRSAYPRLIGVAYARLGSAEEAREAVSETMARAVAGIHRFESDDAGLTPWLVGICKHVVTDLQRSKYRRRGEALHDFPATDEEPGEALLIDEEHAQMRAAFGRLDPDDREVLELRVVAGMDSEEAAEKLGKSPSAVRMAQMRALGRLRNLVEAAGAAS